MKKIPGISEAEWEVMKIIWAHSPITANDVIEKLEGTVTWKPKTIKTLLSRLVKKKVISFNKEGRTYLYFPLVMEEECVKAESQSFLRRVYGGGLQAMLANFLEDYELTKEEIEELKEILDEKKDSKKG
ncbi:BlaI family transcriptional regulator, penicillinase repressor [Anaerovirgula multivorans]|uniref:BlaI family transcriptional regulator, penicillinase repressor n=1 Tax=Anaerovirgula multivorans TaxID=312168 RepID=A0A239IRS5_9FIRM|nr:BlaI/MecI/CopY family transcriptional regulator [Anaerovirgula multivorans]SNS96486.1 BlaI family transcriptional regulator, penicillinase repressor [Anaerovirgula multivorans]